MTHAPRRDRRGSYNAMFGFLLPMVLGFTALAVDTSWIRLADSQAQDVADAASHAALIELRRTGDATKAETAAQGIIDRNIVGGSFAEMSEIKFGSWERGTDVFTESAAANAVAVRLGRYEDDPVDLNFAKIWGRDSIQVEAQATTATRILRVVLVMDITGSFEDEIHWARSAALSFLDILDDSHGPEDMIGMATFTSAFGHEWTPMFLLDDPGALGAAEAQWNDLDYASRPIGSCTPLRWGTVNNDMYDFNTGGQRPAMPREYCDEPSTDHSVGMEMGWQMLRETDDPLAYKAMVVLTDGNPVARSGLWMRDFHRNNTVPGYGKYDSPRFRVFEGPTSRSKSAIQTETLDVASKVWDEDRIHVWFVSFEATTSYLKEIPKGDGKFYFTTNPAELVPIFEEIANSMPLVIVR